MKKFKIILGLLLLYGAGMEYASASRQLASFYSPGILIGVILLLLLAAWLIGSGFTTDRFAFKSFQFLKYFLISFAIFSCFSIFSLATYKPETYIVEFNNIKIELGSFLDGSRRMVPDLEERKAYCACVAEKLAYSEKINKRFRKELESGQIDKIFEYLISEGDFEDLEIEKCLLSKDIQWTDQIAFSMKINLKSQLTGTEFEKTNNIDKYCDCLLEEFQKYPLKEISNEGFNSSEKGIKIDSLCIAASKL